MRKKIRYLFIPGFYFLFCLFLHSAEKKLIEFNGDFLAYSYDHNQILGSRIHFLLGEYEVFCLHLKVDVSSRAFYAYGGVSLKKGGDIIKGEEFLFDPKEKKGFLVRYKENIEIEPVGKVEEGEVISKNNILDEINLSKIQKSFIYCTSRKISITENYEVIGYDITFYVEGIESIGIKKLNLSEGLTQRTGGFALDKIWYTGSQGIITRLSFLYDKEDRINSLTRLNYEEHSVLKNYTGPKRQVDLMSSTTINLSKTANLGITGNYNSSNMWNTNLWFNKKWSDRFSTNFDFSYNKPINYKGEAWFGLQTALRTGKYGDISFRGKYEIQKQFLGNFSYGVNFLKTLNFSLISSYSKVKISGSSVYSEILSGNIGLSHNSRLFNLATDYYLNYDLLGSQLLSQPQLRIGLNPIAFYGGLLSAGITNIFIYNHLRRDEQNQYNYSNNTVFTLSAGPVNVRKDFNITFNISLEQFMEKEGRNFTSTGFIVKTSKEFLTGIFLEGYYSAQSRRRTRKWLIEGTTSQDLSLLLRVNPSDRINGWTSFSFDPKNNQWRQSFVDLSIEFVKNWNFHSLLNYDFLLKKLNNIDLYLIREAGRFQLRFVWRSLSKQFLVELIPR